MPSSSQNTPWIAPSILSADFARLGDEVNAVVAAGADVIHFDVMDNHYVPNLTIGPLVCEALRRHGITAPLDVHLMVKPVDRIVPDFAKAGATYISFHPEASEHVDRTIDLIRDNGCKPGLVFNPATPLDYLEHTLGKLDLVLLMSVNPGFGGQKFIPGVLDKVRAVRKLIDRVRQADSPRDRRRREGGQHRGNRARRRRHVRRRLGDFRSQGLPGDDCRDARTDRRREITRALRRFVEARADRSSQAILVRVLRGHLIRDDLHRFVLRLAGLLELGGAVADAREVGAVAGDDRVSPNGP